MHILMLECRTDALRYQLFDWERNAVVAGGAVAGIGSGASSIRHGAAGELPRPLAHDCRDHAEALALALESVTERKPGALSDLGSIRGVGHRVPHGGERFTAPVLVDGASLPLLKETLKLAPFLNAPALKGIEGALKLLGPLPQVAVFDTAFHHTMPQVAFLYPLPYEWYEKHRIRRYGFHGYPHLSASRRGPELIGRPVEECCILTVHTGEGVSLCLVKNGESVDTSMGFSPLEGMMMERACGNIDAGIIPFMMEEEGLTPQEMERVLYSGSGSTAIAGGAVTGPGREGERAASPRGRLALEMEGYRLRKFLGEYLAVGNPDVLVFSYAEGWADWGARGRALRELEAFGIRLDPERDREASAGGREVRISADDSRIPVFVVPSGEDLVVAGEVAKTLGWS